MSKIQLKTYLPMFLRNWACKNWGGVFSLNGMPLSDELAHEVVDRAIAEGYEYDADVPDEKVREWIGIEAACKQSVTDCNHLGNAAKLREALSYACYAMFNFLKTQNGGYEEMTKALDKAKSALAEPPRNCDVGTAEDQTKRFVNFCRNLECKKCKLYTDNQFCECVLRWAQMPYEEGGKNEQQ